MKRRGVHHVGLATLDIDRTVDFYKNKMGWEIAWADVIEPPEGSGRSGASNSLSGKQPTSAALISGRRIWSTIWVV